MTQTDQVRKHLLKRKSITSMEAFRLFEATRLSAIIFSLRYTHGMKIKTTKVEQNGKRFAKYHL